MDLWQLHIYCKVVDLKSFSKAGEAVHLSQPTVSSHIKDLEAHFGTRLIDRMARKVYPTKAGELLYGHAIQLLALRDKAESAMAQFAGEMKGKVAIGGSTIPAGYLLPQVIGEFTHTYPEVRISLVVGDTSEILAKTASGLIEASIVGAVARDRSLAQSPLLTDQMVLVVPKGHRWAGQQRIRFQTLKKEPFIIREPGSGTLKSLELALKKKQLSVDSLNIIAEMGSTEAIRQAIKSNVGVSILSATAVSEECRSNLLKTLKIDGLDLKRYFYLTTHRQRSLSPLCSTFIEFIEKYVKNIKA